MTLALIALGAYLIGSIPFGLLITRVMGLGDLRSIGSGNIGATNVLRTGNRGAAAATLVLDGAKGAVAVLIARQIAGPEAALVGGAMAFVGHCFPVWLGFRGGKGVATFLGVLLALAPLVGLISCATWLLAANLTKISSLSALVAAVLAPLWLALLGPPHSAWLGVALAALILARHHANIRRLIAGTEPRIGGKS